MSALAGIGLHPAVEAELRWALCEAEGELGLCSAFAAQAERVAAGMLRDKRGTKGVGRGAGDEASGELDRRLFAIERLRRVDAAMGRCSRLHQRVLVLHFGFRLPPHLGQPLLRLRPYEAVCRRLRGKVGVGTARELEGLCLRAEQSGAPGLAARAELAEVRRAAERLVDGAVAELQAAWGAP